MLRIVGLRAERSRRRAADAEVPQLLDLLAAASSAGLAAPLALRRSVEALGGPLGAELRLARSVRIELGARWRDRAGRPCSAAGSPRPPAHRCCARSDRDARSAARRLRPPISRRRSAHARRARTTERARTAPVKMLFPLVFLVLPAFLLLTVVPVLLTTVQSIR